MRFEDTFLGSLVSWMGPILLVTILSGCASTSPQTVAPPPQRPFLVNVKAFGAKGDGLADDTDALQRAFSYAHQELCRTVQTQTGTEMVCPEIILPKGDYSISRPLLLRTCTRLRGRAGATIRQTDPNADVLYFHNVQYALVENLVLVGGRRQLKFWTGDNMAASILVDGCVFRDSESFAIENVCLLNPAGPKTRTNQLSPYTVATDSSGMPTLRAVDESQGRRWRSSAFLIVQNSSFDRCMRAVNSASDQAVVRDCRVRARPDMRGGVFRAAGMFKISRMEGTIKASRGYGQHWVTAVDGNLVIRDSSLLSRSEVGIPAVYNLSTGKYVANSIVIDTCSVNASGSDKECLVYCQEMPNLISVRNCLEMSRKETPILGFSRSFSHAYFDSRKHFKFKSSTQRFALDLEERNTALSSRLPKALVRYARKPLSEETSALFEATPPPIDARALSAEHWDGFVDGSKFGLFGDGATDDTAQLAKAIKAAVARKATLLLPAGIYLIKRPIRLPGPTSIRGVGRAVLKMQGGENPILQGDCECILLRDLVFVGGSTAVDLRLSPTYRHRLMFERCSFRDTTGPGIRVVAGRGRAAEPNRTICRISNSSFANCDQVLHSNAAEVRMDNCRLTTNRDMRGKAAIENLGTLVMENVLGVPRVQKTRPQYDQRWIDNHHRVTCRNVRFGNEGNGLCIVLNRHDPSGKARVLIENSWTWCTGNKRRKAVVWCEELPSWIALRSNVAAPTEQYAVWLGEGVPNKLDAVFRHSSNVFPLKLNTTGKPQK